MTTPRAGHRSVATFLRTRSYPVACCLVLACLSAFATVLATTVVPVGLLTAPAPTSETLVRLAEPAVLATLLGITLSSRSAWMEQAAPRAVDAWHLVAHLVAVTLVASAVLVQALQTHTPPGLLLAGLAGYHGIALLGAPLLGGFGPVLSALFALAVAVVGVNGANEPAWWAWPLEPDVSSQAQTAAVIWLAGLALYLLSRRRPTTGRSG